MNEPKKHLQELGFSESEATVYLAMLSGVRAARDLVKVTGQKRPTVYYALGCLEKRGLISKTGREGEKQFEVEPLHKLELIAEEKMREAGELQKNISDMVPMLQSIHAPADKKPTVAFFEGKAAVQGAIMEMLYCKDKHINSIVPHDNFFQQIGPAFVKQFIEERIRRNIKTKNLWEASIDASVVKQYYRGLSEIKILPGVMKGAFRSSIFLNDNKVLYVSSLKNSYCICITSKEHHDTLQALFDGLWVSSKAHK